MTGVEAERALILAEFAALRAELDLRSKIRYEIVLFTIVMLGTVAAIALHGPTPEPLALFAYPVFASLLSMLWIHNQRMSLRLSAYIAQATQTHFGYRGWELFNASAIDRKRWLDRFPIVGVLFLVAQVTALLFGFSVLLRAQASAVPLTPFWLHVGWLAAGCGAAIFTAIVHFKFGRYDFRQFESH